MGMYDEGIKVNLENPVYLHCALGLTETKEKILLKWYTDGLLQALQENNTNLGTLELRKTFYDTFYDPFSKSICKNYNEIALRLERNNETEKAEDIYRQVLRKFDRFKGCFSEAEISLRQIIPKKNQL